MADAKSKPVFDGAMLSPRLNPKGDVKSHVMSLPIGKPVATGGIAVARAYKHAAGKSSTYSPQVVDMIYHMAREGTFSDEYVQQFVTAKLTAERDCPRHTPQLTWDQLVFLSANLTRLVIDPYREACNSRVQIGTERPSPLTLQWPIVYGGFKLECLPEPLPGQVAKVAAEAGIAVTIGTDASTTMSCAVPRIQEVDATQLPISLNGAAAVQISAPYATQLDRITVGSALESLRKQTDGQVPIGIVAPAFNAPKVIDRTVDLGVDFYVADAQWTDAVRPQAILPELHEAPAIHVLADTVDRLRHHCKEETVQVIYHGGIRGGADAGKAICLGATAVSLGLSAIIGMGFKITQVSDEETLLTHLKGEGRESQEIATHLYNFAKSVNVEVTMLARASGKSSVTNMEPEDLRALTIAVSEATGIPLVGKDRNFR